MAKNYDYAINATTELSLTRRFPSKQHLSHRHAQDGMEERNNSTVERTKRFNLLSLLPITNNPSAVADVRRVLADHRVAFEISGWLAYNHYVNRSSNIYDVLPDIHDRLSTCDVDFHYTMRDGFSPLTTAKEFVDAYGTFTTSDIPDGSFLDFSQDMLNQTTDDLHDDVTRPHAVIGAGGSAASSAVGTMTSAYMIPQISGSSTAAFLDNQDIFPYFSRTVPTNEGDAEAMAMYLQHLNITHVGILYINDGYGNDFHSDLARNLYAAGIVVFSQPYDDISIVESIDQLAASQQRYIIGILNPSTWRNVIHLAIQHEIIGHPDYFWIFGDSSLQFAVASFQLNRESESDLARALHGSAVIAITDKAYEPFDSALRQFKDDIASQQLYITAHNEMEIFNNYTFPTTKRSIYQYTTYDAVVTMMLAVCEVSIDNNYIDGPAIYEQLIRMKFEGVSGYVSFDQTTGTRHPANVLYGVQNIQFPNELKTNRTYTVLSTLTALINLTNSALHVEMLAPLYYASNTSVPPPPLPPATVDMNLIPTSILAFCLSVSGFVIIMSIWWIVWTFVNREKDVVKASQPVFLCQICIGAMIIASAVISMSMQEPISDKGLNLSCMATPWLVSVGFVTTFSALFTKTWRLNKLFKNSHNLRRVVIRPRDVVLPFILLLSFNIAVMLAWTLDAPLVWDRKILDNFDKFGRSVESIGRCIRSDTQRSVIYLSLIVAVNFSVLFVAIYQAYIARNLPSEFSESTYISIAIASLLEVCVLGIPLMFFASSDPTINFLIQSILASVTSLSVLLSIFLPKYVQRNVNKRYHDAVVATTGVAPIQSRVTVSMGSNFKPPSTTVQSSNDTNTSQNQALAPGISMIRRNRDYFKEKETAALQKIKKNSGVIPSSSPSSSIKTSKIQENARLRQNSSFSSENLRSSRTRSSISQTGDTDSNGNVIQLKYHPAASNDELRCETQKATS